MYLDFSDKCSVKVLLHETVDGITVAQILQEKHPKPLYQDTFNVTDLRDM